jgi:hypothetical protein
VDVLDQHDERLLGRDLVDQLDPRAVKAVPRLDRVDVARDVEAERERQDPPLAEHREDPVWIVAVQDAEVLLDDLGERLVRTCRSVRRAATCAT